jgi:hypothetical protein
MVDDAAPCWRDSRLVGRAAELGFLDQILVGCETSLVPKKLSNIFSYRPAIPHSTHTMSEHKLIKWFYWVHQWDRIPKGLRVRGAGLKLFIVSMNDLLSRLCIGYYVWLNNYGAKLAIIGNIFVLTYSFWLVLVSSGQVQRVEYEYFCALTTVYVG